MKVAAIQMVSSTALDDNLRVARELLEQAALGGAELAVEDSGPGIPPAERQRVLDRFYRVPGAPGHGSGLGLAIGRAIAERHGAAPTLDGSPSLGGLRVILRWPAV